MQTTLSPTSMHWLLLFHSWSIEPGRHLPHERFLVVTRVQFVNVVAARRNACDPFQFGRRLGMVYCRSKQVIKKACCSSCDAPERGP